MACSKYRTQLAITKGKRRAKFFMRKPKDDGRHFISASEEWRICLLADHGGFSYKAIAWRVFCNCNPKEKPSDADVSRVGRVLSKNKLRVRDWRDCKTRESMAFAAALNRKPLSSSPKLKVAG